MAWSHALVEKLTTAALRRKGDKSAVRVAGKTTPETNAAAQGDHGCSDGRVGDDEHGDLRGI